MNRRFVLLGLFFFAVSASTLTLDTTSLPRGWSVHDLAREPRIRAMQPGAKLSLTYPGRRGQPPLASVFVYRSKALDSAWPDAVPWWTERLVGTGRYTVSRAATLTKRNGRRVYRIEYGSDSNGGTQLLTAILAIEVTRENETRLVIFKYEDVVEAYYPGLPAVHDLYDVVTPLDF